MANKKPNIASRVHSMISDIIAEMGYLLWDVTLYKEGAELILEISVDKDTGISFDDCSLITKKIEPLIDELNPIEDSYCLMVSSAGSERELRSVQHIETAVEKKLLTVFKLFSQINGKKEYSGRIVNVDQDFVTILENGNGQDESSEIALPKKQISRMTAYFEEDK